MLVPLGKSFGKISIQRIQFRLRKLKVPKPLLVRRFGERGNGVGDLHAGIYPTMNSDRKSKSSGGDLATIEQWEPWA